MYFFLNAIFIVVISYKARESTNVVVIIVVAMILLISNLGMINNYFLNPSFYPLICVKIITLTLNELLYLASKYSPLSSPLETFLFLAARSKELKSQDSVCWGSNCFVFSLMQAPASPGIRLSYRIQ